MLFRLLSPGGDRGRLSIFIFHRVLLAEDPFYPWDPTVERFEKIVGFIARNFNVIPLNQAVIALCNGRLPPASACITFDDGYADNFKHAFPVLSRHVACATFFVSTGYIDGGRMWNDTLIEALRRTPDGTLDFSDLDLDVIKLDGVASRVESSQKLIRKLKYLPWKRREEITAEIGRRLDLHEKSDLMMSRSEVCGLVEAGMHVGSHSVNHPILAKLDDVSAANEIEGSYETLKSWLGEAPHLFAYPNGVPNQDYLVRDVRLVKRVGYKAAVSTAIGHARVGADVFQLPRFTPWDLKLHRFAARCAANLVRSTPSARVHFPEEA